jgi:hypothetical protein
VPARRQPLAVDAAHAEGEGRLNLLLTGSFAGKPFVDRRQFLQCRLIAVAGEFCFYFKRKLGQLLLPVVRPGRDPIQYRLNLISRHSSFYSIGTQRAPRVGVAFG